MRIGIDIRCLTDGKRTGVEEYTINLLENIFQLDKKNEYILFTNSYHDSYFDERIFAHFKNVKVKRFHFPNKLLNFCFWYLNWPKVDKMLGGVELFFMPNINFIALSPKVKLVLTIHDLSFEIFPETFSFKRRAWHAFINPRKLARRADQIISVSDSTMHDAAERFNIHENKISRIYNGVSEEMTELDRNDPKLIEVKERYHLPFNFILYLGTVEPRKNIPAIIKAFDQLKRMNRAETNKYKLVIAGGMGWKVEEILKCGRQAEFTDDIIFTSCITNEDKAAVYTLASLFVYPSFFEGFGIPVLEAMRCGVPVITSNNSSLPEVVGAGAIMVDPDKPDELFKAMKEVLLDRELMQHMQLQSPRQAIRFNWRTAARETLEIFAKSVKG